MRFTLTIFVCLGGYILYGQNSVSRKNAAPDTLVLKYLEEVIVSASRLPERILQSPVYSSKLRTMKSYVCLIFFIISVIAKINVYAHETSEQSSIKVEGEITQPLKLSLSDLEKMKRVTVKHKDHDSITHSYTGVPVIEILNRAGVTMGKQLRGKNLAKYLLVTAADGYQVVFSLAELDTSFNEKKK